MPPKSRAHRVVDSAHFISDEAQHRYFEISTRGPYCEKGFILTKDEDLGLPKYISSVLLARRWLKFGAQPTRVIMPLVYEFLANFVENGTFQVPVRGIEVNFAAAHINLSLDLENFEDEFVEWKSKPSERKTKRVLSKLTVPGSDWMVSPKGKRTCLRASLKPEYRVWYHFIRTKLMPTTHDHIISEERMMLLYAVVAGKSINVGKILEQELISAAGRSTGKLFFPCLITELCIQAGVDYDSNEITHIQPRGAITVMTISRLQRDDASIDEKAKEEAESSVVLEEIRERQIHMESSFIALASHIRERDIALHRALSCIAYRPIPPLSAFSDQILRSFAFESTSTHDGMPNGPDDANAGSPRRST